MGQRADHSKSLVASAKAPQQARSRQTLERLVSATTAVLEAKGLAAITIPEIAATAGISTGGVYRRFTDKDALIRYALGQVLEESQLVNKASVPPNRFQGFTLDEALYALGRGLVAQYRGRRGVLRAIDEYLEFHADRAFRERALDIIEANMQLLVESLLPFKEQIVAEDPERAITFALLNATTLIEVHKLHTPLVWQRMLPLDDEALALEAGRTMAAYLSRA